MKERYDSHPTKLSNKEKYPASHTLKRKTKIYDYFRTPSLLRNIVIGTLVGIIVVGVITGALILSVGTGLSLVAFVLGIIGLFTASFAVFSACFRPDRIDNMDMLTPTKDLSEEGKNQFARIINTEINPEKSPENPAPEPITNVFFLQAKPSAPIEKMYKRLYKSWDEQSTILIVFLNRLEGKIKTNCKNFRTINNSLLKELNKDIFSTESFNKKFEDFKNFIDNNKEYASYPEVIEIFKIFEKLRALRTEYHENKHELNNLHENKLANQAARAAQQYARQDFNEWLLTANEVSIQRIAELYPEEKDQKAMISKCGRLGVRVFDSKEESRTAALSPKAFVF